MVFSPGFDGQRRAPYNLLVYSVDGSCIYPSIIGVRFQPPHRVLKYPGATRRRKITAPFAPGKRASTITERSHTGCFVVQLGPKSIDVGLHPSENLKADISEGRGRGR